jgi:DNA polymerase epsilon subunit 2
MNLSLERTRAKVVFGSNPCRVRFWGKDMVIFRDEVLDRMRRNSVSIGEAKDPKEGGMKKFVSHVGR